MDKVLGGLIVILIIVVSMVLHELAHGVVAFLLGDDTAKEDGRLTLNPIKHLDPFMSFILPVFLYFTGGVVIGGAKPVPVNYSKVRGREWGMALVAIAGPLTNFLLAFIGFLIGFYSGYLNDSGIIGTVFVDFILINLGFMVFNLLPIPPLDGSRALYVLMPDAVRDFMNRIEKIGIIIIYILILAGGGAFSFIMSGAITKILSGFYWIVGA